MHIRGKAKWLPYEQASYLYRQSVDFRKGYRELAEQIGMAESVVKNSVEAYKLMEEHRVHEPDKFSYFLEKVSSRKLKESAECLPPGRDLNTLFVELVENQKIPKAENVRDLPLILNDKKARRAFLEKDASFEDAFEIAKDRHPENASSFYNKLKRATEALENAEEIRIREEVENDAGKKYILKNLCRTVNKFCKAIGLEAAQPAARKK